MAALQTGATRTFSNPPIFVISGTCGAGKSSLAASLMQRFAFGVHVQIDDLNGMVVSGRAEPVPVWSEETGRQFHLARESAVDIARRYNDAGFAIAIDDIIWPDEVQKLYIDMLVPRPVHCVLLCPRLQVAMHRNQDRTTKPFDPCFLVDTIRTLHNTMKPAVFRAAGWITVDSSDMTVVETVDAVLSALLHDVSQGYDILLDP